MKTKSILTGIVCLGIYVSVCIWMKPSPWGLLLIAAVLGLGAGRIMLSFKETQHDPQ